MRLELPASLKHFRESGGALDLVCSEWYSCVTEYRCARLEESQFQVFGIASCNISETLVGEVETSPMK